MYPSKDDVPLELVYAIQRAIENTDDYNSTGYRQIESSIITYATSILNADERYKITIERLKK